MKPRYALWQSGGYYYKRPSGLPGWSENANREASFESREDALSEAQRIGLGTDMGFEIKEVYFND